MTKTKNIVCLFLTLALCLALAACSSGGGDTSATSAPVEATATPEDVYASEYRTLADHSPDFISIRSYNDDGFYFSKWEKVGENIPEGVKPQYEGQYDVYQTFLYYMDKDGKVTKLENYKPMEAPTNEEGYKEFYSGSDLSGIRFTPEGFVTLETTYASWSDGDGNYAMYSEEYFSHQKFKQNAYVRSFDRQGNNLTTAPIDMPEDGWLNAYNMQLDDKGNVIVSDGQGLRAIGMDGQDAYQISLNGYVDGVIGLPDGRIAVATDGDSGSLLSILDSESGKLIDGVAAPNFDLYSAVTGNSVYDIYYTSGASFYGFKLGDTAPTRLFNWLSCDVNGTRVSVVDVSDDGVITGIVTDYDLKDNSYTTDLVTVKKVPYDSVPHKQSINLAVMYLDYNVQDMIIDFNRINPEYRIEVTDYSEYAANADAKEGNDAGLTKLNTEILSGNVPDMLCLNGLNYRQLASKGVLEDLYPYIENDSELKREDFFPNVLKALEVDGKLCSTVSGFYINSAIGAASVVGDEPGWDYDAFNAALASMPEGCTAFDQYVTRDGILSICLALDMADFVDWNSGKVSFDSPEFIQLLRFADSFPSEFDWENYDWSSEESSENRLAQGKQMLVQTSAYSIDDIFYNNYTQFLGGKITYIGYPTAHGTGNMISFSDSGYAMSSKTPYKDACWQFLRGFLTKDYQVSNVYSLPSRLDVFDERAEEATTIQYQKNEEGQFLLDDDGEKIPIVRSTMWNKDTQKAEEIYALTEDQVQQIRELILTTTKVADYDQAILDIVTEQAAPYFAGQKTAEEVAKLVQSKANIYVNEQR
ncbi:MAG: extracellular solute-binding protein [Oscillospiraceae bacterium]|nr:extracellular solute-binding protein [Oscillospiraceae bacterium]